MKKLQRHFAPTPAAISETGGRNGTKSLAELSEIPTREPKMRLLDALPVNDGSLAPAPTLTLGEILYGED